MRGSPESYERVILHSTCRTPLACSSPVLMTGPPRDRRAHKRNWSGAQGRRLLPLRRTHDDAKIDNFASYRPLLSSAREWGAMTAKEKYVLVDPLGKQEGRDARGRFGKGHSD